MRLCGAIIGAFFVCLIGCNSAGNSGTSPGELLPDVAGVDLMGQPVSLSSKRTKLTLVNFWATWCAPCVTELPALERTYQKLKHTGFSVVGVAIDDTLEEVQSYQKKYVLSYPLILDADGKSKRIFGLRGVPESFLIDQDGKVILVTDPDDGSAVSRLVGPREWDSPAVLSLLQGLVPK